MTHIQTIAVTAQATFGRDEAMFNGLLGFVAQLSVVLWGLVILTAVIRFVGIRIYRRGGARAPLVGTVAPAATLPAATLLTGAVRAPTLPASAAEIALVQPSASQLPDAGLVRLGPFGSIAAEKDVLRATSELVDVLRTDAATTVTVDEALQPAEALPAVAAHVKMPHRAPRDRRAGPRSVETRSAAHVPAFASHSTEA